MLSETHLTALSPNCWISSQRLIQSLPDIKADISFLSAIPLVEALKKLHTDFSLRLHKLGSTRIETDESTILNEHHGYGREVQLCLNHTPVVWARSICTTDATDWQQSMQCGTQTLGSRIYHQLHQRSEFEFACLHPHHHCNPTNQLVLARRSCFTRNQTSLLLTETFLPAIQHFYRFHT